MLAYHPFSQISCLPRAAVRLVTSISAKTARAVQRLASSGQSVLKEKLNAPQVNACRQMRLVLTARMDAHSTSLSNVSGRLNASSTMWTAPTTTNRGWTWKPSALRSTQALPRLPASSKATASSLKLSVLLRLPRCALTRSSPILSRVARMEWRLILVMCLPVLPSTLTSVAMAFVSKRSSSVRQPRSRSVTSSDATWRRSIHHRMCKYHVEMVLASQLLSIAYLCTTVA